MYQHQNPQLFSKNGGKKSSHGNRKISEEFRKLKVYDDEEPENRKSSDVRQKSAENKNRNLRPNSKMERGISKAGENEYLISLARSEVESRFLHNESLQGRNPASEPSPNLLNSLSDSERKWMESIDKSIAARSPPESQPDSPDSYSVTEPSYHHQPGHHQKKKFSSFSSSAGSSASSSNSASPVASASVIESSVSSSSSHVCSSGYAIETPISTFALPDLTGYSEDFRAFLEKDLIELSSLVSLEASGRLNWWTGSEERSSVCQRLWPLATTGDGNCLLHAASLGMWGFHDRLLTLRKALHAFMSKSEYAPSIYRRWRWQSHLQNMQYGLILSEAEWAEEWKSVLRLASSEPRVHNSNNGSQQKTSISSAGSRRWSRLSIAINDSMQVTSSSSNESTVSESESSPNQKENSSQSSIMYESLEEIHVLALAHVLRRPIIVVADTILRDMNGEALAPIPFGGVYLPLECPPVECRKNPLLLTFNAGHFSALVNMQQRPMRNNQKSNELPAVIPLTDSNHILLPLHFAVDPGENFSWNREEYLEDTLRKFSLHPSSHIGLLNDYLDIVKVALPQDWQENEDDIMDGRRGRSSRQNRDGSRRRDQSLSKQFGSIGRKLKKNLGKLTSSSNNNKNKEYAVTDEDEFEDNFQPSRNNRARSSGRTKDKVDYSSQNVRNTQRENQKFGPNQKFLHPNSSINKSSQNPTNQVKRFIFAAFIHSNEPLPYQNEMIENYLQEAKRRFEFELSEKDRRRREAVEENDRRQREIYLNGGYVDCVSQSGCSGQGRSETNYLCKQCYQEQTRISKNNNKNSNGNNIVSLPPISNSNSSTSGSTSKKSAKSQSRFYVRAPVCSSASSRDIVEPYTNEESSSNSYLSENSDLGVNVRSSSRAGSDYSRPESRADSLIHEHSVMRVKLPSEAELLGGATSCNLGGSCSSKAKSKSDLNSNLALNSAENKQCKSIGCEFYGTPDTNFFCSKCFIKLRQ